ncbi:unnamed protein product [Mytilus edulis]|uniref:Uncharacterized protein n=1 Tax=Mytilus edulis TaxID=6550 RepID=A0A8S3T773_MYTED|nr:unnamed protein product [Mytilus edulis]
MEYLDTVDKQCESIDFSNSCRQFYMTRLKATEDFKRQAAQSNASCQQDSKRKTTKIDSAMETLRTEMASLMDQDLSLMKQLLTLNETIEEIKFKRLHGSNSNSMGTSSCNLDNSEWYVGDNEVQKQSCDTQCERLAVPHIPSIKVTSDSCTSVKKSQNLDNYKFVEKEMIIDGTKRRIIHGRGNFSMDSGYDETEDYQTDVEVTL